MITLYNLIWFILVGLVSSIIFYVIGFIYTVASVGEYGQQLFRIGAYLVHPCKRTFETNFKSHMVANIVWIILFGWWICALYIIAGLFLCCTLVGIPFGLQCFKNLSLVAIPFGSDI